MVGRRDRRIIRRDRRDFRMAPPAGGGGGGAYNPLTDLPSLEAYWSPDGGTTIVSNELTQWDDQVASESITPNGLNAELETADATFDGDDVFDWSINSAAAYQTSGASPYTFLHSGTGGYICADVELLSASGTQSVVDAGNGNQGSAIGTLLRYTGGTYQFLVKRNGGTNVLVINGSAIGAGRHRIVATYASSPPGSNVAELWVNGVLEANATSESASPTTDAAPEMFAIGGRGISSTALAWEGKIHSIALGSQWLDTADREAWEAFRGL